MEVISMKLAIGDKGPAEVVWDYGLGQTNLTLSPVLGTISLTIEDHISNVEEENYGDAPVDAVFMGTVVGLSAPMTRSTLDQLQETLVYDVLGSRGGVGNKVLTINNVAGCDMYAKAKQIVIVPMCNNVPDPDPASWTLLYKCYPYRTIDLGFDRSTQRIHLMKFMVFPNQDSAGGYCGEYGTEGMSSGSEYITGIC